MRTTKQIILRFILFTLLFIFLVLTGTYLFRDLLLQKAITKIEHKFQQDYNCTFTTEKATFEGLSGINLQKITLVPKNADTLLSVEKITVKINLLPFISGDIQLKQLEIHNGFLQLVKNKNGRNFDSFFHKESKNSSENEKRNYAKIAYILLSKALNLVPEDLHLKNISLKIDDMGRKVNLQMEELLLKNKTLKTTVAVNTKTVSQNWNIKGFADPRNKQVDLRLFNSDTSKIKVPYIDERFSLESSFDAIRLKIEKIDMSGDELHVDGFTSISNFTINNPRISKKEVVIKNARFDYRFLLGTDFVSIDSSSTVQLNAIKIHPYLEYNTAQDTIYSLHASIPTMKANDFITSLPEGLFSHFEGMEAEGQFGYQLDFKFNKNKPNTLVFDSHIEKQNLKIIKYGAANLAKINSEFIYRAIDNGRPQRAIVVGLSNTNYTPFDQITPYLQKCVLTSEDPSFFSHRGFINEAFKQSILKNIRTKKFARGASTISMQLVKNVFLNREKTLSRKLEEILLVYILENNRIATKQRMLEVYFNVIEWGPNVYGIGEAAQFYFLKKPIDLSLKECLFLATIVPKPKKFMYQFDNQGQLKTNLNQQQTHISNLMLRRGIIIPEDTIGQSNPIKILGNARSFLKLKVQDSIPTDSLFINEMDSFQ